MLLKKNNMKNRKIKVTEYALADVIEALTSDPEHFTDIVVTKEDGHLVVMFNPTIEECKCLNELIGKAMPRKDEPDYPGYPMRDYPMHGDPILCDTTTSAGENNTNVKAIKSCETLY